MPTVLTHAVVPFALGLGLGRQRVSTPLLTAGGIASALPDLDVLAFRLGIPYADAFGHRGASHSLAFALILGFVALAIARQLRCSRWASFLFVAISAASHGVLDMLTNGGYGVALLWPVSQDRFFFPVRLIEVSPLSMRRIMSGKGLEVLQSELLWIWLPATIVCICLFAWRRRSNHSVERT